MPVGPFRFSTMKKDKILKRLAEAGVEVPAGAKVADLEALAKDRGVSLEPADPAEDETGDSEGDSEPDAAADPAEDSSRLVFGHDFCGFLAND